MTNEELDEARAKEAWRKCDALGFGKDYESPTVIAARLAREGWMPPPPPVDPDLIAVRELLSRAERSEAIRQNYLNGRYDTHSWVESALVAYKAGKEAAR
jgi:hypothetical protein